MRTLDQNKDYISNFLTEMDWERKLEINLNNINATTELFLCSVDEILDQNCPLKKVSNSQKRT